MYNTKKKLLVRIVALILVLATLAPLGASAAVAETVQPRASSYLDSYSAYVYPAGSGKVQVYYSVVGANYMDEIGYLRIAIYESTDNSNFTWVKTFTNTNTPSLLGYDKIYHSGHVDYQGVAGRYYKAYVCVWAGENGSGDTRYFWTSAKKAT